VALRDPAPNAIGRRRLLSLLWRRCPVRAGRRAGRGLDNGPSPLVRCSMGFQSLNRLRIV
jgi:hypothetical protein